MKNYCSFYFSFLALIELKRVIKYPKLGLLVAFCGEIRVGKVVNFCHIASTSITRKLCTTYPYKVDNSCDLLCCRSLAETSQLLARRTPCSCYPWGRCIVPQPRLPPENKAENRFLPLRSLNTYTCT